MSAKKNFTLSHAQLCYGFDTPSRDAFIEEAINSLDPRFVHRFGTDGALGIDDVHEIHRRATLSPGEGLQVFVIGQADIMTLEAHQALLKILEEPPQGSVFFLSAATCRLPDTILSRVRIFPFLGAGSMPTTEEKTADNPLSFFDAEIAKLKKTLEDRTIKDGIIPPDTVRRLIKCVELSTLLYTSRISPRHLMESYRLTR